jgi:hypothetical protein
MLITTIVGVIAVIFAIFASYVPDNKKLLKFSFLVIFMFLGLRYDFGNDYKAYYDYFTNIHRISLKDLLIFNEYQSNNLKEVGYTLLNKIFPNFYLMIAILSLFSCYIYYDSIKKYVPEELLWFSIFIYIFNPYFMLVQSSAIRQTIAICLFIYSIQYIIERKFLKFLLFIILGGLFHKSAFILLPIFFLATPTKWNKFVLIALGGLFIFLTFFGFIFIGNIESFTKKYFNLYHDAYMSDIVGTSINSGFGYLYLFCIFLLIIWSHNKGDAQNTVISKLSLIGFVLYPIGLYLTMFGRIGMYLSPIIILSLPFAISKVRFWQLRIIIIGIITCYYLYEYINFFQNPVWIEKFYNYKTIM